MWNVLKAKLQGNDEESRSKLLTKFMTMKKSDDLNIEQFANKLKRIQELLNGADKKFITDKMVMEQIFANAGPSLDYLTNSLRTTPDLNLTSVLKRYELAEETKEARDEELKLLQTRTKDSVSALATQSTGRNSRTQSAGRTLQTTRLANSQTGPRQVNLPVCPENWNGHDCWFHTPATHSANACDALRVFQIRF